MHSSADTSANQYLLTRLIAGRYTSGTVGFWSVKGSKLTFRTDIASGSYGPIVTTGLFRLKVWGALKVGLGLGTWPPFGSTASVDNANLADGRNVGGDERVGLLPGKRLRCFSRVVFSGARCVLGA
jgi:hypothetical protein